MARFKYLNIEPNKEELQDCVIRAISLATAIPYDSIVEMLAQNGDNNSCDCINVCCYTKLIEDLGYYTHDVKDLSVEAIADKYPNDVVLIRIKGHLTCAIDGCIYDLWDCRDKIATRYWIII